MHGKTNTTTAGDDAKYAVQGPDAPEDDVRSYDQAFAPAVLATKRFFPDSNGIPFTFISDKYGKKLTTERLTLRELRLCPRRRHPQRDLRTRTTPSRRGSSPAFHR